MTDVDAGSSLHAAGQTMKGAGQRTAVVAALAAAVAIRVSVPQPLTATVGRIAHDPGEALARAADGWSVGGELGGATAQGLRDLPLATFLWLTDVLRLPAAVGQSAWWVLVLVIAVTGAVQVARAVRPGTPGDENLPRESWASWVAAVLYACGPVLLATTASSPTDGLVVALLPWVLAPLLRRDPGWRGAARSAAWLGLAGAGSPPWAATAVIAGLLASAPRSRSDLPQLGRWLLLALLACSWWVAAFVWELRHAVDLSELVAADRWSEGARDAVGGAVWSQPWVLVTLVGPMAIAGAALTLRAACDRFLVGGLVAAAAVGVAVLRETGGLVPALGPGAAYAAAGTWGPLFAWVWLAALVGWRPVVDQVWPYLPRPGRRDWTPGGVVVAVASAGLLVGPVAGPLFAAREPTTLPNPTDPQLWARVASWSESAPPGRVLVLPATDGRLDGVLTEALGDRPWVGRDALPVSGAGATGAVDDLLWRLSRGDGGPATAGALQRLGIAYVLLRNDVSPEVDRDRPAGLVRQALSSYGASRVVVLDRAEADARSAPGATATLEDFGIRSASGGVEIWALPSAADAWIYGGAPLTVAGDAGAASDLAAAGLATSRIVRIVAPGQPGTDLVSDSARRRDVDQRVAVDPFGPLLTADAPRRLLPPDAAPPPTAVRRLAGAAAVTASSSAADLGGSGRRSGSDATAAVDGNVFTAWQSRRGSVVGQWWEITFDQPTDLTSATVQVVQNAFAAHRVTGVRVETDAGGTNLAVPADGLVALGPVGTSTRLRIRATAVEGRVGDQASFGIAELSVPDVIVHDQLAVSSSPTASWLLAARPGSAANCVPSYPLAGAEDPAATATTCDRSISVDGPDSGSLLRVLQVDADANVAGRLWMRAADTETTGRLADRLGRPSVIATGSSVASQDSVTRPQAAVDADLTTAWRPAPEDPAPVLELSWPSPVDVTGLRLVSAEGGVSSQVTRLQVEAKGAATAPVTVDVAADGSVSLPQTRTTGLTLTVLRDTGLTSLDTFAGGVRHVPVAVAEVEVTGGPQVRYDQDTVERLPCGSGPNVTVAGEVIESAVTASARSLVKADVVLGTLCRRPTLPAGEPEIAVEASFSWLPLGLVLSPPDGPLGTVDILVPEPGPVPVTTGILGPSPRDRTLDLGSVGADGSDVQVPRTLVLALPAGSGWTASVAGSALEPATVDGWAQAWVVPAGVQRVDLDYSAGDSLRLAAGPAALGWLVVLVCAAPPRRRARRDHAMTGRSTHA